MRKKIFGAVAVTIILIGIYFIFSDDNSSFNSSSVLDTNPSGSTETDVNNEIQKIKVPDLNKKVNFSPNTPSEAIKILNSRIEESRDLLFSDRTLLNEWLNLGINLKVAGDYQMAKDVWEYASFLNPENSVSFLNLGDLYGYYLKDLVNAEKNYRKAVDNDLMHSTPYLKFADFYLEVLSDKQKAVDMVKEGLSVLPNDDSLQMKLKVLQVLKNGEKGEPKPM
jgi:tetratricopeptide (TPR) repeat protein